MATTTATAHSKVVARLQAQIGSGLPTPLATVYSYHKVANLVLDAITVEPLTNIPVTSDGGFGNSQFIDNHEITVSIRVHTSYSGGIERLDATMELTDLVITSMKTSMDLGDRYKLMGFSGEQLNAEFEESQSVGAEVLIIIHKVEGYAS